MCYACYNYEDDRPDDDWDDERIEYFYQRWLSDKQRLFDKAMIEYAEEHLEVMAPEAANADPDTR